MAKWEYKQLELDKELSEKELNDYGKDEWELMHHQSYYRKKYSAGSGLGFKYHFKRTVKRQRKGSKV